jgi:bacterioferritin
MYCDFSCDEFNQYRVNLPYPATIIEKPDLNYARLVSGIYACKGSESTAIAQYTSHRYFTQQYSAAFTAYKYITIVETVHLELLGNLILDLGCSPLFFSYESKEYWSGSYPDYQYTLKQILESDIQGERGAIAHYTKLISLISNESIQALFRRIILDEERHIEVLSGLILGI